MSRRVGSAALADTGSGHENVLVEVCNLVSKIAGIQLGERQYSMVESRLRIRMLKVGVATLQDYLVYLRSNQKEESTALLSLLTTHHTYFFREFSHFEFVQNNLLSSLIQTARKRADKTIRLWSAACSRGQEVYSLAMFLDYHLSVAAPDVKFEIWGSDVDPESVSVGRNGVYLYKDLMQVPAMYMGNHWVRGTGDIAEYAKVKQSLKSRCHFNTGNLISDTTSPSPEKFDLIFCRNVFIYFNNQQIQRVCEFLIKHLQPEGRLFVGVSETLAGIDLPVEPVGPSVYGLKLAKPAVAVAAPGLSSSSPTPATRSVPSAPNYIPAAQPQALIRVLCVDDSPSIHTLLKKVLAKENGFEIVGNAMNGKEAVEMASKIKFDIMTLDIHMPEMDGLQYLKQAKGKSHPPVVMLSSVQRENADLAMQALENGAIDYVEKPNLANLLERGDEIRSKLKTALIAAKNKTQNLSLDKSFAKKFTITNPEKKMRVVFASLADKEKVFSLVKHQAITDPALVIVFEGAAEAVHSLAELCHKQVFVKPQTQADAFKTGSVYMLDLNSNLAAITDAMKTRMCSVFLCGAPTQKLVKLLLDQDKLHLVLEDLGEANASAQKDVAELASATTPITSYLSISEEYLN